VASVLNGARQLLFYPSEILLDEKIIYKQRNRDYKSCQQRVWSKVKAEKIKCAHMYRVQDKLQNLFYDKNIN
jgi:hypothetical protein